MHLEEEDLRALERAVELLEQDTITETLTQLVGTPIDYLMSKLPKGAEKKIYSLVEKSLNKAANAALWSLDNEPNRIASTKTNKFFAALSGAIGGAFGFSALAIELPVSTTIMLRSIADIARSEGFDLDRIDTKLECLAVFSFGGPSEDDDAVNTAYYATRNLTAEIVQDLSKEISNIAVKNAASTQTGKWLASLIEKVATRFGIVITEKMAAQAAPVIGALAGATLNTMFTDYYQDMARGHFIVKRLERKYGDELIKAEYIKILDKLTNQNQRKHLNSN